MSETKIVTVDFDKMINRCSNFFNNVCETETEERVFDEAYYLELEEKEKQESFKNSGVGAKYLNMRLSDYETPTEEQKGFCLIKDLFTSQNPSDKACESFLED